MTHVLDKLLARLAKDPTDHVLHVILIEDSLDDAQLILWELEKLNGKLSMVRVDTADEFQEALRGQVPDLVVSDYSLPRFSVVEAVQILEEFGLKIPFYVLSGKVSGESIKDLIISGRVRWFLGKNELYLLAPLLQYNLNLFGDTDDLLQGWVDMLDVRDIETAEHSERVTQITVELARQLGVSADERVHIRRGALVHDIGKMGIPDAILLKPGKLTPEEFAIMQRHVPIGYERLSKRSYLKHCLEIPLRHHERWDGSGYPDGLRDTSIPQAARIFAVVDVLDALTSDRPYRKAQPLAAALEHIQQQSGILFDPQVVSVFLSMFRDEDWS